LRKIEVGKLDGVGKSLEDGSWKIAQKAPKNCQKSSQNIKKSMKQSDRGPPPGPKACYFIFSKVRYCPNFFV